MLHKTCYCICVCINNNIDQSGWRLYKTVKHHLQLPPVLWNRIFNFLSVWKQHLLPTGITNKVQRWIYTQLDCIPSAVYLNCLTHMYRIPVLNLYPLYRMAMHTYSPLHPCQDDSLVDYQLVTKLGSIVKRLVLWRFKITQSLLKQPKQLFEIIFFK